MKLEVINPYNPSDKIQYHQFKFGNVSGYIMAPFLGLVSSLHNLLDDILEKNIIELFRNNQPNLVASVTLPPFLPNQYRKVVIKKFGWRNPFQFRISPFLKSRASKSFFTAIKLMRIGLGTPIPIVFFEERKFRFITKNYYITQLVENSVRGDEYFHAKLKEKEGLRDFLIDLSHYFRVMHDHRILHRDFNLTNVLVTHNHIKNRINLYITDLNRARRLIYPFSFFRAQDIARLELHNHGREFIGFYCGDKKKTIKYNFMVSFFSMARRVRVRIKDGFKRIKNLITIWQF